MIDDKTRAELEEIAARYSQKRSGLLPMLHLVQSVEGRVTPEGIDTCAEILDLAPAEVSGVATFYTMYKRRPVGDYHVGVCTNTLCAAMGGDAIYAALKDHLGVEGQDAVSDDTCREAREIIERYPKPRSALLPLLHLVQSVEGYVSSNGIGFCAEMLGLTKAEVGAVATPEVGRW